MKFKNIRIGDLLISKGYLTEAQLKVALEEQKKTGKRLGEVLVELGYINEHTLLEILSEQLSIEKITLDELELNSSLKNLVPENIARKYRVIPIKVDADRLYVAMSDPSNLMAIDELSRVTRKDVIPMLISNDEFLAAFNKIYGGEDHLYKIAKDVEEQISRLSQDEELLETLAEDSSAINLVNSIIAKAINEKASDIHIEPDEDVLRVRFRIDGLLHEILTLNKMLAPTIISRIKIMANMNIAEKRIPQDGRFKIKINFKDIDFRVSTLPTNFGEKAVLRVLDRSRALLELHRIGMDTHSLEIYESLISKPYGIILISGPTGSGKTTTLYATLNKLNSIDKNIITIEDPIEYNFKLINQVQVDETAGVTFASALRSILRQDPDIIMVGEIRDKETAQISIQASLTGHLVLATIHTNDAVSSVVRLVDMGIEPYLVSSSLVGVVAQRLVRKVCLNCAVEYTPSEELLKRIDAKYQNVKFVRGEGCHECHYTGYKDRIGIYEVLKLDSTLREMISNNANTEEIKKYALQSGFRTMFDSGMKLASVGITTLEEVLRVTTIENE
ncbi:type II secretion system protein GspE [Deferribacter autotrophicus]|uniref:Type II secretion system protein GspE n=1 Tax=Deferribacter autotrophicus TaxID=500465 RepID=A0A5A8F117_9BACT|nr:GspE/PulE family protein [Deferribacter autotrophicus]KAA0257349.1 type II secretion system protein GspE [Deferribacter autotrophicus]